MNTFNTWKDVYVDATLESLHQVTAFLPNIIGGLIVLIIGLLISAALGKVAKKLVQISKIDNLSKESSTITKLNEMDIKATPSGMVGWMVKWFFIIVTFIAVADILNLHQVNEFLNQVIFYVPNIVAAVLILVIGIIAGDVLHRIVETSVSASETISKNASLLSSVARWSVIIFSVLAALSQLNVASRLIEILVAGVIFSLAIGVGLGMKDRVKKVIDNF